MITQEVLDLAKKEKQQAAFSHIKNKLTHRSDLELLSKKRQDTLLSHTDKLGKLKARVQAIVTNVEEGLNDVGLLLNELKNLRQDMNNVKNGCKDVTSNISHFSDIKELAKVIRRLEIVDSVQKKIIKTDHKMSQILNFIQENPNVVSVKCFKEIIQILDFGKELINNSSNFNHSFIQDKFALIEDAKKELVVVASNIVTDAFKNKDLTTDLLARAIWIVIASSARDGSQPLTVVKDLLSSSISNQFKDAGSDASLEATDKILKNLEQSLDGITDQLDIIIPALPQGDSSNNSLDIMEVVTKLANEEVVKLIEKLLRNSENVTSFHLSHIILWLRNYSNTMVHMLGVNPSKAMINKISELENSIVHQIPGDLGKFLDNVLDMEYNSIDENRQGVLSTQLPNYFMTLMMNANSIKLQSNLPNLNADIDALLVETLENRVNKIGEMVDCTYDPRYCIACVNNSLDGVRKASEMGKQLPDIITSNHVNSIKAKWANIQSVAMNRLANIILENTCQSDNWDMRINFFDKFEQMTEQIASTKKGMVPPLFRKFFNQFAHSFSAHYLCSYLFPLSKEYTPAQYSQSAIDDPLRISKWIEEIAGNAAWVFKLQDALKSFSRFVTEDSEFTITHVGKIIYCFNDFNPNIIAKINKVRPGSKSFHDIEDSLNETYKQAIVDSGKKELYIEPIISRYIPSK